MPNLAKTTKPVLSVFDFDGTLTRHDSFVPFLRFAFGNRIFALKLISLAVPSLQHLAKQLSRDELKEKLIASFLTGVEQHWLEAKVQLFYENYWHKLMRPAAITGVAAERERTAEVTLCSASPALVLQPFAKRLGVKLIGTELAVVDGKLTGQINGANCRRTNKIKRLEAIYGDLNQYHLRAWGDSQGDFELLEAAQEAHWQPFRS